MITVVALIAVVAPPLAESARDDVVAAVQVPQAARGLAQLEQSRFGPLLPLLLSAATRQALRQAGPDDLVVATRRDREAARLDTRVESDAAALLARDPELQRLVAASAGALWRGRLDLQRYYGHLARVSGGGYLAGVVRRLGLDTATAVTLTSWLRGPARLETELRVVAAGPPQGALAAFGPAVPLEWPAEVPKRALGFVRASVRPARLWVIAQRLFAQARPLESTLVEAQLAAIADEARLQLSDALGDEPRTWVLYVLPSGGEPEPVLVAPVADATGLGGLLERYGRLLPSVAPDLRLSVYDHAVGRVLALSAGPRQRAPVLLIACDGGRGRLIVARTRAALDALAKQRRGARPLSGEPALVAGVVRDRAVVSWLYEVGAKPPGTGVGRVAALLRQSGIAPPQLEAALASSSFGLRATTDGLLLSVTTSAD